MEARAILRYARISPRKVSIVMDLIRNKPLDEAMAILQYTPKAACEPLLKLVKSAAANAENNFNMDKNNLYVAECYVCPGPTLKRMMPRAQGRGYRILKRTSHTKKDFSDNLVEDHKIRTELKALLKDAGVPKIEIERTVDSSTSAPRVTVNVYCAKPGMVIGKGGEERVALQNKLTKEYGKTVVVNVIEVKSPSTNAQLVAEDIARQLENRVTFRRAMKQCIRNAMSPRDRSTVPAKGIKAMCSGRLAGADIARTESYHEGTIPLQTLRADIDYGFAEAATTYGRIGVKVWIYKGEVLKSAKNAKSAPKKEGGNK